MKFNDVEGDEARLTWSYFLQEMAARGVLMRRGGLNFVTFSHTDADIDEIGGAAGEVFAALKPLWKSPDLAQQVKVKEVSEGFRRFS